MSVSLMVWIKGICTVHIAKNYLLHMPMESVYIYIHITTYTVVEEIEISERWEVGEIWKSASKRRGKKCPLERYKMVVLTSGI